MALATEIFKVRSRVSDKVPSSSMADIAFLLLIFFLITTTFPKDKGLAIVLPEGVETAVNPRNVLHLIVRPDGLVDVKRGESTQVQRVAADDIETIWRQDVRENANLIAAVKTHPEAPYKFMLDVLDALHMAGAERISLQLLEG